MATVQDMPQSSAASLASAPLPLRVCGMLVTWLASDGSRPDRMRLVSIAISHYVEKVRWALDILCLARNDDTLYTEDGHLPAMHSFFSVPASGGSASMTPMLLTRKGDQALWDSTKILTWLSGEYEELSFLYPPDIRDEVLQLEELYDEKLGVPLRRFAYSIIMNYPELARAVITAELSWIERLLFPIIYPELKKKLGQLLSIDYTPESTTKDEALTEIIEVFDEVAGRLSDGRKYLTGDRFTAADIAFASLCYPVAAAVDRRLWGIRMPSPAEFPEEYNARLASLIEHPAGKFAVRVYQEHRFSTGPGVGPAANIWRPVAVHWNRTASYVPVVASAALFVGFGMFVWSGCRQ